jgi:hypothetical protein
VPKGRTKKKNGRGDSRKPTEVECDIEDALPSTQQIEQFNAPVSLEITDYRVKLCDTDGSCEKLLVDAIVSCGILQDDSAKYVAKIIKNAPIKVKNRDEEKTILVIEEI